MSHAFEVLGLAQVRAGAHAANEPSVRILQRLGMTDTGRGGAASSWGGRRTSATITAAEWRLRT